MVDGTRLRSRRIYPTVEDCQEALFRAVERFKATGRTPTDLDSEAEIEEPVSVRDVMTPHLDRLKAGDQDTYQAILTWCRRVGPMIRSGGTLGHPSFGAVAVAWIAKDNVHRVVAETLALSTAYDYRNLLARHILATMGPVPIRDVTRGEIKDLLLDKASEGLAASTCIHIRNAISGVFNRALEHELVEYNPAIGIKGAIDYKAKAKEIDPLTSIEVKALLKTVEVRWPRYYPFVAILALAGVRAGEALALTWGDVDYGRGVLHVKKSLSRMVLGRTKGRRTRKVDMPEALAGVLRVHRTAQKREAVKAGRAVPELVNTNLVGGYVEINNFRARVWKKAIEQSEVAYRRIHDLRHTYATIRISRGDDIGDVSAQLGHHSVQFTMNRYYHWMTTNASKRRLNAFANDILPPVASSEFELSR